MWTNLNPVNESEEFISNWRIQKSKDNGSDIIAQPRSTSFLTFCQFRWTFTGSSELAWAAKNYCQNAITVHDTTGPSWKPTKLKARNENVKEVSDEQHSLVWFWCATLIITWKKLRVSLLQLPQKWRKLCTFLLTLLLSCFYVPLRPSITYTEIIAALSNNF